jgi:hypothetical protein
MVMTVRGRISNGAVVLSEPVRLPDGTDVEVELRPLKDGDDGPTLFERFKELIGTAEGLPEDMAENHDHNIHGTPKR